MSRIGRQPILVPAGVEVHLDGPVITVKGPRGTLTRSLPAAMTVETSEGSLLVTRPSDLKQHKHLLQSTILLYLHLPLRQTDCKEKVFLVHRKRYK